MNQQPEQETEETQGWQVEKHYSQRVYHYIDHTFSLCGKLGLYIGELAADNPEKRSREDCKACIKKLEHRK